MDIDVKVFCDCGEELKHVETRYIAPGGGVENGYIAIDVKPCETCLDNEGQKKFSEGYDEGCNSDVELQ